jgi:catechol 2,3-dioxygenase-like lactoylglutathione lyase family enzyme
MSCLDHIGFSVADHAVSRAFYLAALAPLGIGELTSFDIPGGRISGFGRDKPEFWVGSGTPLSGRLHVAFSAASRADVDAFHAAAMKAGATDNGPPGLRPHYHKDYYGAFVLDPDGHNIEAVCHGPR